MLTRENFTGLAWRRNARSRRTTAGTLMIEAHRADVAVVLLEHLDLAEEQSVIARCQEMTLIGSKP